ncbi:MAG: hypothetical protein V1493_04160 [Candidatus Diapherotrites archaeon]
MNKRNLHKAKGRKNPAGKGFIFSVDALGAIAVVIVLGAIWILSVHHSSGMLGTQIEKKVRDDAMVSLYKNDLTKTDSAFASHADFSTVFCKKYFIYDDALNNAKEYSVCGGVKQ